MATDPPLIARLEARAEMYDREARAEDHESPEPDGFCSAWGGDASRDTAKLLREAAAALRAGPEPTPHRCVGCGHRWDGPLEGATLCGDCWRKAQPVLHARALQCPTHGDPLVCLACEAEEDARPEWRKPCLVRRLHSGDPMREMPWSGCRVELPDTPEQWCVNCRSAVAAASRAGPEPTITVSDTTLDMQRYARVDDLWPLIQALERAAWSRKWSAVKAARKALETVCGKRPHDPLFAASSDEGAVQAQSGATSTACTTTAAERTSSSMTGAALGGEALPHGDER